MNRFIAAAAAVTLMTVLSACSNAEAVTEDKTTEPTVTETSANVSDAAETVNDEEAKTPSCSEITAKILENEEFPSMAEVGTDRAGLYLDLEIPADSDFSMYICGSGGFADEVCVIGSADLDSTLFEEAVEKRIDARKKDFEGYNPDEFDKLDSYYMEVYGNYFIYAVTPDNDVCQSIFNEYVK